MLRTISDDKLMCPDAILVQDSCISGRGLFSGRSYRAHEALMIVNGESIDETEALRRERSEANWYIYWNHGHNFIDAGRSPKGRYLNHACQPNTITAPRDEASLYIVALRDIEAGEELTMDYDYPAIYEVCRNHNPGCLQTACPRADAIIQGENL